MLRSQRQDVAVLSGKWCSCVLGRREPDVPSAAAIPDSASRSSSNTGSDIKQPFKSCPKMELYSSSQGTLGQGWTVQSWKQPEESRGRPGTGKWSWKVRPEGLGSLVISGTILGTRAARGWHLCHRLFWPWGEVSRFCQGRGELV